VLGACFASLHWQRQDLLNVILECGILYLNNSVCTAQTTRVSTYFLIIYNKYNLQQCLLVLLKFIIKPMQNDKKAMGELY
jgi:hypothetical protein